MNRLRFCSIEFSNLNIFFKIPALLLLLPDHIIFRFEENLTWEYFFPKNCRSKDKFTSLILVFPLTIQYHESHNRFDFKSEIAWEMGTNCCLAINYCKLVLGICVTNCHLFDIKRWHQFGLTSFEQIRFSDAFPYKLGYTVLQ